MAMLAIFVRSRLLLRIGKRCSWRLCGQGPQLDQGYEPRGVRFPSPPGMAKVGRFYRGVRHARSERGEGVTGATRNMSEVRKWLDTTFETNDLDVDLLGQVDDQLLKDIGVSSAGHRLRIRNAITKLGAHFQSETAGGPLMSAGAASAAERRQVTVMFSNLVVQQHSRPAWTLKTSARSFQSIRSASQRPCSASAASLRSTWAMGC